MTRKIVALQALTDEHVEQIRVVAPEWELIHGSNRELMLPHLKEAEILLGWSSAAADQCIQPDSKLRWVQNWNAGVDRLPLASFAAAGILLTNASGVHPYPISETVMGMLLSLTRQLHQCIHNQRQRKWARLGELHEMHGKTVGIVGVGAIGSEVARLCKAFGMQVLGVRRSYAVAEYVDSMVTLDGLDEVLRASDYVVVTLPLTEQTKLLMGRTQFRTMKPSAYYINIGRGGTTDEAALIEALCSGTIAGAGLDVFEVEPLPENSLLWQMDNVIITPHNSGSTVHYNDRAMGIFLNNLRDYTEGKEPQHNRVDLHRQY
ncbi:D-2-hydroxyacid dehydrogenase [Paenibacillus xerothermodurans]|uniref:D-2-hydroxyacid dehydrogenase n=1 Tax=Paenibacillus xerothermodurans TaxID=1977292 RepID=UPI001FB2B0D4|nr:D-2-hydroxyacid dehydrogenase [Paenibacillus xerothermodurans]